MTIGSSVKSIGEYAFYNCYRITSLALENIDNWCCNQKTISSVILADKARAAQYLLENNYYKWIVCEHIDDNNDYVCDNENCLCSLVLVHTCDDADGDYVCDVEGCNVVFEPAADSILTVEEAIKLAQACGASHSSNKYYVTGIVSDIPNSTFGDFNLVAGGIRFTLITYLMQPVKISTM